MCLTWSTPHPTLNNDKHPLEVIEGEGRIATRFGHVVFNHKTHGKLDPLDWAQIFRFATYVQEDLKNLHWFSISKKVMSEAKARKVYEAWFALLNEDETRLITFHPFLNEILYD